MFDIPVQGVCPNCETEHLWTTVQIFLSKEVTEAPTHQDVLRCRNCRWSRPIEKNESFAVRELRPIES